MEAPAKEVALAKKKTKKTHYDLKLPEFIRIDWRRPKCTCRGPCMCSSFACRMTFTSSLPPVNKEVSTKQEDGIDWSKVLNIDLLNLTSRRAKHSDFDAIWKLIDDNCRAAFEFDALGAVIKSMIEHAFTFLVIENFQNVIVGAICVNDIPPLSYMPDVDWDSWLHAKYELHNFRHYNTLWINFMAYAKRYKNVIFHYLLVPIFRASSLVSKIAIYLLPGKKLRKSWACYFRRVGTKVKPKEGETQWAESDSDEYPTNIYCVGRNQFLEPLMIREPGASDKEAILKTLEGDHKSLVKRYGGDYFEKIMFNRSMFFLIGTTKTKDGRGLPAVFTMKTEIDLEDLKDKFEIYSFNNFKRHKATDYLMQPEKRYISAVSQEILEMSDVLCAEDMKRLFHEQDDKEDMDEKEEKDDEEGEPTVIEGLTWTNFLMTGTQDSDEEEGRGMDRIITTDNPIDKITYKNLCMTMSTTAVKDFTTLTSRQTQQTQLSFELSDSASTNAVSLEFMNMGSHHVTDVKRFFMLIMKQLSSYEYIILKVPRKSKLPCCVNYMMRVPPRGHKNWLYYEEELFICHRWFLTGIAECRKAVRADFQSLLNVLCMEHSSEDIQEEMFASLFAVKQRNTAVIFSVNKKIVGAAIVSPEREMEFYKFHYDVESVMHPRHHTQAEVGYVKHMVINGLHEFRTREFIRKAMKIMGWKSVFFNRYPFYISEPVGDFSLLTGLRHFVPVKPRRVPMYVPSLRGRIPPYHLRNDYPPFALYYLNYRISAVPKNFNYTKIVVVGTGETGLSFLEDLIFRIASVSELFLDIVVITKQHFAFTYPHKVKLMTRRKKSQQVNNPASQPIGLAKVEDLRQAWFNIMKERLEKAKRPPELSTEQQKLHNLFKNTILSSTGGASKEEYVTETTYKKLAEVMIPRNGRFTSKYLSKLGLDTWVTVVVGTMTGIHREEKVVEVDGKKMIPYDHLFLFCGKQFCTPQADHRNIVLGKECKALYDLRTPWVERVSLKPRNLFTINCLSDASNSLQYIKRLNPGKGQIIVYGSCINCLSCIEALLKFGVNPSRIAFVESDLNAPYAIDYFNDPVVYKAVRATLFEIGISHYFYYNFVNWDYNETTQLINKAHFESESRMASLKCLALFSFSPKEIAVETLLAYMDANLVYDGGLVIDAGFRTNDPFIYGAGPGTRYKNKYHANHYFHHHYNSAEIGSEMADRAYRYIPDLPHEELAAEQDIVDFKKPIVTSCCMPGGKHLLMVRRPGPIVPLEVLINQLDFGSILVTGKPNAGKSETEYFKIILNDNNYIIDIVCLSSVPIDRDNLIQLYGRHEKMLNNILRRYNGKIITDLYDYFKEPWAYVFYHDRFESLVQNATKLFYANLPRSDKTFADVIAEAVATANWEKISSASQGILEEMFIQYPQLLAELKKMVKAFLNENSNHLPMALNEHFDRAIGQIVTDNFVYLSRQQRMGGKPLVSRPYSFEKHKQMYRPKVFYERIE